jgi:hypothetical protein
MIHESLLFTTISRGLPMPAQILTLWNDMVEVPSEENPELEIHFDMSDLNTDNPHLRAILLFRVKGVGAAKLTMKFNRHRPCINKSLGPAEPESMKPRSWHENIMVRKNLKKQNNVLHVTVTGPGHVEIGDISLIYHAT